MDLSYIPPPPHDVVVSYKECRYYWDPTLNTERREHILPHYVEVCYPGTLHISGINVEDSWNPLSSLQGTYRLRISKQFGIRVWWILLQYWLAMFQSIYCDMSLSHSVCMHTHPHTQTTMSEFNFCVHTLNSIFVYTHWIWSLCTHTGTCLNSFTDFCHILHTPHLNSLCCNMYVL